MIERKVDFHVFFQPLLLNFQSLMYFDVNIINYLIWTCFITIILLKRRIFKENMYYESVKVYLEVQMLSNISDIFKISHIPLYLISILCITITLAFLAFLTFLKNIWYYIFHYILYMLYNIILYSVARRKYYGISIKFKITFFKFPLLLIECSTIYITLFRVS